MGYFFLDVLGFLCFNGEFKGTVPEGRFGGPAAKLIIELAPDLDSKLLELYEKPKKSDSKWSETPKNQFSIP